MFPPQVTFSPLYVVTTVSFCQAFRVLYYSQNQVSDGYVWLDFIVVLLASVNDIYFLGQYVLGTVQYLGSD